MIELVTILQIAGFVDDTTILLIQKILPPFLFFKLQECALLWERLLHTTGGKLEVSKCCFSISDWSLDTRGKAYPNKSTPYN
jgi:hypothetical protein